MATVIGLLTETGERARVPGWRRCAAVLQQLLDVNTSLRRIVFTVNDEREAGLPAHAVAAITKLGGELVALKNSMPMPPSFGELLDSEARRVQYRKLALWSHTEFAKIIAIDADVFVARRIDEMATFPADTFSPNLCSYGCDRRVAGFNSGVMVLAPSAERSAALARYARLRASMAATDEARARDIAAADGVTLRSPFLPSAKTRIRAARQRGRRIPPPLGLNALLVDADQSFLAAWFADVQQVAVEADSDARAGHGWTWRSVRDESLCKRTPPKAVGGSCGGTLNIMSRRYNERPGHCDRCDRAYEPSIIHFTCALKPWFREAEWWRRVAANVSEVRRRWRLYGGHADEGCHDRTVCSSCIARLALRWHDSQRRSPSGVDLTNLRSA